MEKKAIKKIIKIILYFAVVGLLAFFAHRTLNQDLEKHMVELDGDWTVSINDSKYENIELSKFDVPELIVGDKVIITGKLCETGFPQSTLRFLSEYSAVKIYLEDELLKEYGTEYYEKGSIIGSGYNWVELPENFSGKFVTIELVVGEKNAFSFFDIPQLIDSNYLQLSILQPSIITGIIACCLIVMGIICLFGMVIVRAKDNRVKMLLWLGCFCLFIAGWMICNNNLPQIVNMDIHMGKYMEYICMYFACASMIEFVAVFLAGNNERKFFWILGKFFWGLSAVLILLNITNIRHFPKTVIFFQLFSLLSAIGIIYMIAKASVKKRRAEQTFLSGIVVFFLSVVLELVRYRYNKMCVPENVIDQSFIPVGAMLFIVFMAGGFFYRILEHVEEELERKTLYDMAFQDAMTGIRNRAWCEKVMHEFQAEKMPVTIINMDLNLFKEVNDTYGHSVGDDLLIEFAGILSEVFKSAKCVGRMGGDEFVVITQRLTEEEIRAWIRRLIAAIEKENEIVERPYKISVSYGYASSEDGETSPWHVYEQADKQMYEYKKKNREMK